MLRFVFSSLAGVCLGLLAMSPALADWTMSLGDDPDGRGRPAILLGEADEGRWLQLWCRGEERRIAILVNDGKNDEPAGATATLEIAADTGSTWRSDADFYRHAPNWLGLSYRNLADMQRIVDDLVGAQGNIGFVIGGGEGGSDIYLSAVATGSTTAGRQFAEACFGATPSAAPAAPAPAVSAPATPAPATPASATPASARGPVFGADWKFAELPPSGRFAVELTAPSDSDDAALRIACNPEEELATLGIFDRRGFAGDGAYEMTVTVDDDLSWTLPRTTPERSADGVPGVVSADYDVLYVAYSLTVPKKSMRIDLVHAMGARRSYRFDPSGAVEEALEIYYSCLGDY